MSINYKCRKCGHSEIDRVIAGATVSTRVEGVDSKGNVEYGHTTEISDGDDMWFECAECGAVVLDAAWTEIQTDEELVEFLKNTAV